MLGLFFLLPLMAVVPKASVGPDIAERSRAIDAPMVQVTVFSDRARVRREVSVQIPAGVTALRLPDLPGATMLDTVRVDCQGARALRVEASPIERERVSIDQVDDLLNKIEALVDELSLLDARRHVRESEIGLLTSMQPREPVPEKDRVGRPQPPVLPAIWRKVLDFISNRTQVARQELRSLDEKRRVLAERIEAARREAGQYDLGGYSERKLQVVVVIEAESAATARMGLEYFVPGAAWWPAYDLDFLPDKGQVALRMAGLVQQATGEDWNDVELNLSTAIPGQGFEVPELLTWTLGEKREFIPVVRPARMPPEVALNPPPSPRRTPAEAERAARQEVLSERLSELQGLFSMDIENPLDDRLIPADLVSGKIGEMSGEMRGHGGYGASGSGVATATLKPPRVRPAAAPARQAPPPPPAPESSYAPSAPVMEEAARARPRAAGDREAYKKESTRALEQKPAASAAMLELFERQPEQRVYFSDQTLPAVVAGGFDYVWKSATKMDIPSRAERLRVPVEARRFEVELFYEATPALKKTAYLKAVVVNREKLPILAGPMNIFVGGDFSGAGQLRTTGPGGTLELPLGADEDIRFERKVVPSSETKGLFKKEDVTNYEVTIEVGNYKKRRVRVTVYDVLPKSNHEKVEIEKGSIKPPLAKGPDADGVLRWDIDLPAGSTRKITFGYRILRPKDWQLYQL